MDASEKPPLQEGRTPPTEQEIVAAFEAGGDLTNAERMLRDWEIARLMRVEREAFTVAQALSTALAVAHMYQKVHLYHEARRRFASIYERAKALNAELAERGGHDDEVRDVEVEAVKALSELPTAQ